MKKLLFFLPLLFINCGCQAASQQATQTYTGCPQEPKAQLRKENVKEEEKVEEVEAMEEDIKDDIKEGKYNCDIIKGSVGSIRRVIFQQKSVKI